MTKVCVFDSGIGGLTVVKSLLRTFPDWHYIYLGDTARLPYGNKSPQTIRSYLEQCLGYLEQFDPDVYVVACNSASTQAHEKEWKGRPLFNVIDPVIDEVIQKTQNNKVGVIATRATVNSRIFSHKINTKNPNIAVIEQACPLFVPLAEEGWIDDPITNLIAYRYLTPLRAEKCDTVVLGCTHYPILVNSVKKALSNQVCLISSGEALAQLMQNHFQVSKSPHCENHFIPKLDVLVTDLSPNISIMIQLILGKECNVPIKWVTL
ncbi:MAG: glutamate racemase [Bdellovibrionaceae bacterium]|nr:glutamate racemase [Pseudobdellovibrionaceae bacterium]MDW8189684.1 glutamate racemase [Pseudobdellovibrionaceae bacterium]